MKLSTGLLKFINQHYNSAGDPAPEGPDALMHRIGAQLAAVEEFTNFGKKFEEVIIVKVVSCEDHPNADRLHVCKVDDGGKAQNVDRDDQGLVQDVCGAPNVHADMLAAWLPPGSTVPNTVVADPFVLEAREIRGVVSNGMMASPKELALGDGHEGILEVNADYPGVAPGVLFVDAYHLRDDFVIDMENKMFTHRPDCFGWLGLAREIEGIHRRPYKSPEWYRINPDFPSLETDELKLEVRNELPDLVPRFAAITLSNVKVGPSPVWLQVDLARAGLRSINNIVDYTNFYMLETGQPLHAYDYDKVKALSNGDQATIVVRYPNDGEKLTLLNGKEIEPRQEAIMIATDKQLIGVGGVMGGGETEVDNDTKNIILECANFDMYSIRRTSMAHGLFTDAVTRFNKGQSPLQNLAVLAKIVSEIREFASGKVASALVDDNHVPQEAQERGSLHAPVSVDVKFINDRLGWNLSADEMAGLLANVEFKVHVNGSSLMVTAPFWRTDIEIPEDVVEEVGRLYGYDHLNLELPIRNLTPAAKDPLVKLKTDLRHKLSAAGANEVLTYTFVHGNLIDKVGQNRDIAYQLSNALSPDLQYYRLSLTPSLLDLVHPNIKAGQGQFALYEINKAYSQTEVDEDGLPRELTRLSLVFAADDKTAQANYAGSPYYQARYYLAQLYGARFKDIELVSLASADMSGHEITIQMTKPYEPNRSAALVRGGKVVGVVGEYRPAVAKALKLPAFTAGFEVFVSSLNSQQSPYQQLPKFPKVEQDICLKVPAGTSYAQVFDFVNQHLEQNRPDKTHHSLSPVDIYQKEDDKDHKQITLRLKLASFDRTLTDVEVNKLLDDVATAAKTELGAERI